MNRTGMLVGLMAGIVIGYNWPRIKKDAAPAMEAAWNAAAAVAVAGLRVVVQAKEDVEDMLAERKARAETAKEVNVG